MVLPSFTPSSAWDLMYQQYDRGGRFSFAVTLIGIRDWHYSAGHALGAACLQHAYTGVTGKWMNRYDRIIASDVINAAANYNIINISLSGIDNNRHE